MEEKRDCGPGELRRTEGTAYIQMEPLATKADIDRLEALIDRRLPHVEMVATELCVGEPLIDMKTLARELAPYIIEALRVGEVGP